MSNGTIIVTVFNETELELYLLTAKQFGVLENARKVVREGSTTYLHDATVPARAMAAYLTLGAHLGVMLDSAGSH